MFKTSSLFQELNIPSTNTLTPIRDYDNDYFHSNDDKLPNFRRVQSQSHRLRISNPYYRLSNTSTKRPASLDLSEITINSLPSSKKMTPMSNVKLFDKTVSLKEKENIMDPDTENKTDHLNSCSSLRESVDDEKDEVTFYQIIREFYESEIRYIETMQMATCVYRKALHNNSKFKNKIIKANSLDEILLFGNIDIIASISKIFVATLNKLLLGNNIQGKIEGSFWDKLYTDSDSLERIYNTFDIGNLFEQHIDRIKTTYLNYFVTDRK